MAAAGVCVCTGAAVRGVPDVRAVLCDECNSGFYLQRVRPRAAAARPAGPFEAFIETLLPCFPAFSPFPFLFLLFLLSVFLISFGVSVYSF